MLLLFSHAGFSQWSENFEGAPAAPAAGGVWTLPSGDWHIFDNGVGSFNWRLNTAAFPAFSAPNAAFINNQFIGQGSTSIDYLATPLKTLPPNAQLRFQTRMGVGGNQGTIFEIRAAAAGSDPAVAASYTTLIATFSEDDLSATGSITEYVEKVVNLPASLGASAYIAFVKIYTQTGAAVGGDRWLVDDVRVVEKCLDPTTLTVTNIGLTSAQLGWANPSNSTQWEVEIMPFAATPTGTGVLITQNPFTATAITVGNAFGPALMPGTQYKFRVRSVCAGNVTSDWSNTFAFATSSPGLTCNSPIIIGSTPYSTTDNTANYADDYDVTQPAGCAQTTLNYMTGNDVFYSYTPTVSGAINIKMTPTAVRTGIFVYQGCANVGVACLAGVGNTGSTVREIPSLTVTAGVEYIIVISSANSPQTSAYTLIIQTLNCAPPTGLSATGTGPNSANLSWSAGVANSWEVFVQTAGSPVPTGAGVQTSVNTNFEVTTLTGGAGLVLGTPYQYWVRADCGNGTFSPWTGPYLFNTTSCSSGCNYNFIMTDSYGDSWNGNTMNVVQNGVTVATLTGPTTAQGQAPITVSVPLCDGPFSLFWNAGGSYPTEVGISIQNSFGQIIYTKPTTGTAQNSQLYSGVVNCSTPDCLPPTNLTATTPTSNGASLNWTPNGPLPVSWQIYAVLSTGAAPTAATTPTVTIPGTTTLPYSITGLLADTTYKYYVRAVCTGGGTNPWSVASANFTTLPTCPKPTGLAVASVTQSSATFSWTPGGAETAWQYIIVAAGSPVPAANDPNWQSGTSPMTVNTLAPGSNYSFYVRAVCSPTDSSTIAGPLNFFTTQVPATLPFTDTFENNSQFAVSNGTQTNKWIIGTATNNGGTHALYITNDNGATNTYVNTTSVVQAFRDIQIPAVVNDINLSFDWRNAGESCCDYFRVWLVPTTFTPTPGTQITAAASGGIQIGANNNLSPAYQTANYVIPAAAFAGQVRRLVFEWRNDGSVGTQPPAAIDNVMMSVITCSAPTALVVNTVTQSTAQVTWTGPATGAQSYDYYYSTTNTAPAAGATPNGNVVGNTVTLSGLTPSTTYYFWVRSNCGATDGTSTWTGTAIIVTTQIPATLNFVDGFETLSGWSTSNGTLANKWVIGNAVSNSGTQSLYITNNNGTSNAYTVNSTTVVHAYRDIQMPAVIGDLFLTFDWKAIGEGTSFKYDYFRVWMVPATFVPTPGTQITAGPGRLQVGDSFNNSPTWITENILFSATPYSGQVMRMIFEWRNDGGGGTQPPAAIDNVMLTQLTCPAPINLTASSTSNGNNIALTWTPVGTETQWEVVVQVIGGGAPTAGTVVTTPSFTYDAMPGTFYEFFVRAICSEEDSSFWAGPENFSIYSPPGCAAVDLIGVGVDIVDAEIFLCAGESQCVNLEASFYGIAGTESYEVSSIDYNPPFPFTGGTEMPITSDDDYTPSFDLPFNFCFFGEVYDYVRVGDNGVITFGLPYTTTYGDYCSWILNGPIPNANFSIKNAIYGVFQDMYTTNNPGPNTSINYQILGTYPCRALVVNFNEVPAFGSSCTSEQYRTTTQIVLYEISNIIEIYVQNRTACPNWQEGKGVIGIQNAAGTVAYVPPGRNTGAWNAANEAWRFAPNGASNVDFQWLKDGEFYSNEQNIEVCISAETNMVAQATYVACDGTEIVTSSEVTIKTTSPLPTNDPITILSCTATGNAIFDLTPNTATILTGVTDPNFVITYYLTEADALAGTNAITDITQVPGVPGQVIYVRIAYGQTQCFEVKSFELQLGENSTAVTEFSYTSPVCITGTNPTPIPVPGFTVGGTYTSSTGLAIDPSTGLIDLANSTAGDYDVVYTYTSNNCIDGGSFTSSISIIAADVAVAPANVTACNEYTLPVLAAGNYFELMGGQGQAYVAGDVITESTTLYVYSANGDCTSEDSFTIAITTAVADAPADVVECTSYILPALSANNAYYTQADGPNGTGVEVAAGTAFNTVGVTTLYVYASNGSCFDETSFTITIAGSVTADVLQPVTACDSYELQPLNANNSYFTGPNRTGEELAAGSFVTTSGVNTIYINAQVGDCSDESIFTVTINTTPVVPQLSTVTACDVYDLPTVAVGDYYTAPGGPNGTGTLVVPGTDITTDTTLWIYAQTNTTPNCTAESSFDIIITNTPTVTPIADVEACQSYTLPAISGNGNYFSQEGGQGPMNAGDVISTSQMVYVYAQDGTCTSQESFMVSIGAVPEFNITSICENNVYTLRSNVLNNSFDPQGVTYTWTSTDGTILGGTSSSSIAVSTAGTYTLKITSAGCPDQSVNHVVTSAQCMIQKGISANGDGVNDCFKLNSFNVDRLSIFNRYGMKVYERANYTDEWCGQSDKGDDLPDGTYYYVIERASEAATTGWIYISREN